MIRPLSALALVLLLAKNFTHAADVPKTASLPKPHPDWKIELVAEPPVLKYPSVVTCAPDGRIFVAQDPADMPGPSNEPIDSILCIHPDGHITKFAEGLHAVFGLAYLDGKLFVHHCPDFSVFDDDNGVGKNRVDLFKTNPDPNVGGKGFNDHIPSNMRLAMDGYFYMSVGDKGIFNCVGKDGSKIELHGGGVIRFRPDGTHLEVFATGTRNHLDVAINAEDEIFTYDNTDDGNGWWTRVTHIVDGGYYGYPYDYQKAPHFGVTAPSKETLDAEKRKVAQASSLQPDNNASWKLALPFLPAMTDFGGGSPTGAICYNEDALPDEYRGNLFLCEWGRRQLLRLRISRDGATYKVDERVQHDGDDFLVSEKASGKREFRPVGIAVSPDGMSFYIADWNFGGWRAPETAGRLLKVTYTGKSHATPKPAWFVPAATGKKFDATDEELIEGLKHPAQSVRMVAQRRLAERGENVIPKLKALLVRDDLPPPIQGGHPLSIFKNGSHEKVPNYARWHAIWTLNAIDGGKTAWVEILAAAQKGDDTSVRAQAMRHFGEHKVEWDTVNPTPGVLNEALNESNPQIRRVAAIAIGRIGKSYSNGEILHAVKNADDPLVRYAMLSAVKRIGQNDPWWAYVAQNLHIKGVSKAQKEFALQAMTEIYDEEIVKSLARFIAMEDGEPNVVIFSGSVVFFTLVFPDERAHALRVLAELHRQRPPWDGQWWGTQPVKGAPEPKNVDWAGTPLVLAAITRALGDPALEVRRAAVEAVQIASHKDAAPALREMFTRETDANLKKSILLTLGSLKDNAASPLIVGILEAPVSNGKKAPVGTALRAVRPDATTDSTPEKSSTPDANSTPSGRLGKASLPASRDNSALLETAIKAAGQIGDKPCVDALAKLADTATDADTLIRTLDALGNTHLAESVAAPVKLVAHRDAKVRNAASNALANIGGNAVLDAITPLFDDPVWDVRKAAIATAGALKNKRALSKLLALYQIDVVRADALAALVKMPDVQALDVYLDGLGSKENRIRDESRKAIENLRDKALPLVEARHAKTPFTGQTLRELQRAFDRDATARKGPLFAGEQKPSAAADYEKFATTHDGDANKGRKLFDETAGCVLCHAVNGKGGQIGPELTGIGTKYARATLIESVLYPSKQIFDGYRSTVITTKSGDAFTGFIRDETPAQLVVLDAVGEAHPLIKDQIFKREESNVSLMPEGLQAAMSLADFADLIAYLESLKEKEAAKK